MKTIHIFLVFGIFCLKISKADIASAKAIQIVAPFNHTFQLQFDPLKPILENEKVSDRNVVVVSIAGAFRQEKSFLLNFFLKYLYAQVSIYFCWVGCLFTAKQTQFSLNSTKLTMSPLGLTTNQIAAY